jgi:hypothetical protein
MTNTLAIANEIKSQLFTMDKNLMWCLGTSGFIAKTNKEGKPTLTFKVKGVKHKGFVDIALNEGLDLYEVKIYTIRKVKNRPEYTTSVVKELKEVYVDSLPGILEEYCY